MKAILSLTLLSAWALGTARADAIFTLNPSSGAISGWAGETVGWGFDLTADSTYWTTIIGTVVLGETDPALGTFTDFISPQGGPGDGVLPPGSPDWVENFDPVNFLGFGSYAIAADAPVGASDSGTFLVQYEQFSGDPATCVDCFVSSNIFLESFTVNVVSAPEPSTWVPMLIAVLLATAAGTKRLCPWNSVKKSLSRRRQTACSVSFG